MRYALGGKALNGVAFRAEVLSLHGVELRDLCAVESDELVVTPAFDHVDLSAIVGKHLADPPQPVAKSADQIAVEKLRRKGWNGLTAAEQAEARAALGG